jgi:hypothetical protein
MTRMRTHMLAVTALGLAWIMGFSGCESNPAAPGLATKGDPYPYMSSIVISGPRAYVACQRLDNFKPADTSCIAVVVTTSNEVTKAIKLRMKNPSALAISGSRLYVSSTGSWTDPLDGAIEWIDLGTDTYGGITALESAFNGEIGYGLVVMDGTTGYVSVSQNTTDFSRFWTAMVRFNPTTDSVGGAVKGVDDVFGGAVACGSYLYVGDRSNTRPGIVAIDPATDSVVGRRYDVGPAPSSIAAMDSSYIVATTTPADYSSGNCGYVSLADSTAHADLVPIHSDAVVKTYKGSVYVLERNPKNNIIRFDGINISSSAVVYQRNLGSNTNIQDIAFVSDTKAYVTQLQSKDLLIIDPQTGAITGTVDLSAYNAYKSIP